MSGEPHHLTRTQALALLEERDTLRERVRQLEEALVPTIVLPKAWALTQTEARFARAVRSTGADAFTRERAMAVLYGMADDVPDHRVLDRIVCFIRAKLVRARAGIAIETVWGIGWRMPAAACARFDAAVLAERAAWGGFDPDLYRHPVLRAAAE